VRLRLLARDCIRCSIIPQFVRRLLLQRKSGDFDLYTEPTSFHNFLQDRRSDIWPAWRTNTGGAVCGMVELWRLECGFDTVCSQLFRCYTATIHARTIWVVGSSHERAVVRSRWPDRCPWRQVSLTTPRQVRLRMPLALPPRSGRLLGNLLPRVAVALVGDPSRLCVPRRMRLGPCPVPRA
jgi:hypothetical protein